MGLNLLITDFGIGTMIALLRHLGKWPILNDFSNRVYMSLRMFSGHIFIRPIGIRSGPGVSVTGLLSS